MNEKIENFKKYAKNFGINFTATQIEKFVEFEKILKDYNSHTNLMSSNDINLVYEKHFTDSLAFIHFLNINEFYKFLDIGSGGGFPVIPASILLANSQITALDATKKKTDFLLKIKELLGLKNLTVINERAENIAHLSDYRECYDVVTSRAVGNLLLISELAIPFLKLNGKFLAYKSAGAEKEISDAEEMIKVFGGKTGEIFEYELNLTENFSRNIVEIDKIAPTPIIYPRSFSVIKKQSVKAVK